MFIGARIKFVACAEIPWGVVNRFAEGAILNGGADIDPPVGLCADVFAQGDHPACIGHERVDGECAAGIEPIFFKAGVKAGGEWDEDIFKAGEYVPACFDDDAIAGVLDDLPR